jgi:capsule polysaccharide export protein KpsE/RkpR
MDKDAKIRELDQRVIELENNLRKADAILAEKIAMMNEASATIETLESRIDVLEQTAKRLLQDCDYEFRRAGRIHTKRMETEKRADCMEEENRALRSAIEALHILAN